MKGIVPGLKNDCAIIGLSEKGFASIKLKVEQLGWTFCLAKSRECYCHLEQRIE